MSIAQNVALMASVLTIVSFFVNLIQVYKARALTKTSKETLTKLARLGEEAVRRIDAGATDEALELCGRMVGSARTLQRVLDRATRRGIWIWILIVVLLLGIGAYLGFLYAEAINRAADSMGSWSTGLRE